MGQACYLDIKDKKVLTTEVTYEDLVILYQQYIDKYGKVPTFHTCDSKHNMPQGRIINKVIEKQGITYNDFLLQFGKVSHVRTENKENYDKYVKRFKEVSEEIGHTLRANELINNPCGLPNQTWFVKNCPDKNVKTYNDFVKWCGYKSNKLEKDKEEVIKSLIELEKQLGRPITKNDIKTSTVGFSLIVLTRMFGGLNKAKEEIGLMKTPPSVTPKPFEYYKNKIDKITDILKEKTDRDFITWGDIENIKYDYPDLKCEHKTLTKAFNQQGIDIFAYIKTRGFLMSKNSLGKSYTFDDGERVMSAMEYDFSKFLRELGFEYKKTYFRDIKYSTFSDETTKINCDYKIMTNNKPLYIEIAGIIHGFEDWRTHKYSSKRETEYQQKMLKKEKLLIDNNCQFIFLFDREMYNGNFKNILMKKIEEMRDDTN